MATSNRQCSHETEPLLQPPRHSALRLKTPHELMITCRASSTALGAQHPLWLLSKANPKFLRSLFLGSSCQLHKDFAFSSIKRIQWKPRSGFSVNNNRYDRNHGKEGNVGQEEEGEREVHCEVEVISWRERRIKAEIKVDADIESLWNALTDYEHLADFIPNLVWRY